MKRLFLLVFSLFVLQSSYSQVTLDHVYTNAGYGSLYIIHLGEGVYNYLEIDQYYFTLYNMNHSVNIADSLVMPMTNSRRLAMFSNTLFDCDQSTIEYVVMENDCPMTSPVLCDSSFFRVYRTDGSLLFSKDSVTALSSINSINGTRHYITNTPAGTKLLLEHVNGSTLVYDLCDTFATTYLLELDVSNGAAVQNAYPNPTSHYTTIEYTLPEDVPAGELIFYDMNGMEVERFKVNHTFDHLKISTGDLPAGTYLYQLRTAEGKSGSKKLIKIK